MLHAARWKYRTQNNRHFGTIAQLRRAISSELRHVSTIGKIVKQQYLPHMFSQYGELRPTQTAEICWRVWGALANFNGFQVLATLLHGILVVGVSQSLRRLTEDATYIRQGGHYVRHWLTFPVMAALCNRAGHYIFALWFLSSSFFLSFYLFSSPNLSGGQAIILIFALWFPFFFFFLLLSFSSPPYLSGRRCLPYFHTQCDPSANLECRSEMCCTRLAGNTGRKIIAILVPSHNFVGLYLRN